MINNLDLLKNYKTYVGPIENWDYVPRYVIPHMFNYGLRPNTRLLDIGCGSLRNGRFLIPFLDTGNYHGLEPQQDIVNEGLKNELISEIVEFKKPQFYFNNQFEVPDIKIDMAIAIQVFIHCGPEQLKQCLSMLQTRLVGPLLISLNIGDKDKVFDKKGIHYAYIGASHAGTYYTTETAEKIFNDSGFTLTPIHNILYLAELA